MAGKEDGSKEPIEQRKKLSSDFSHNHFDHTTVRRITSKDKSLTDIEIQTSNEGHSGELFNTENKLGESNAPKTPNEKNQGECSTLLSVNKEPKSQNEDDANKELERTIFRLNQWPATIQIITELVRIIEIGFPVFITNLIMFARFMVSFGFIQALGSRHLASSSLAFSFCNISGYSVLVGFSSSMETVASQAYGAHKFKHIGLLFRRYVLLMACLCLPIALLWLNTEAIFLLFNQDPSLSKEAGHFAAWLIPDLVIISILLPFQVFLRAQCVVKPLMIISLLSLLSHFPLSYFFVFFLGLGTKGGAIAIFFSSFLLLALLSLYFCGSEIFNRCWSPWSTGSLQEWLSLLLLAIPSFLLTCLEWWSYELFFVFSTLLPNAFKSSSTMAILLNTDSLFYLIFYTMNSITGVRVGMLLGSNSPASARHAMIISLGVSLVLGITVFALIIILQSFIARFYGGSATSDVHLSSAMLMLAFCEVCNAIHSCAMGVFVGLSYHKIAVVIIFFSFYIMGLPVGGALSFVLGFDVHGLLFGILVALVVSSALSITILFHVDWLVECDRVFSFVKVNQASSLELTDIEEI